MKRDTRQAFGLFLALLAIAAQLTLAAAAPASAASLASVTALCQHDASSPGTPPASPHQSPDCLLCFFCHNATGPAGLVTTSALLPLPTALLVARTVALPPATAPPPRVILAARPRGPPIPA
jgi:hypothetical protein